MHIAENEKIKKTFAFNVDIFKSLFQHNLELTSAKKYVIIFSNKRQIQTKSDKGTYESRPIPGELVGF